MAMAVPDEDLQSSNEEVIFFLTRIYKLTFRLYFGFKYYLPKLKAQTAKHITNNIYFRNYKKACHARG